jgi:L-ascorbate metabolism protein UlaG (beta-lactamase superfamily)
VEGVRVTHVGGPTVLLEVAGWRILTDPTFDPPGRTYAFGWGSRSTKLTGPALSVDEVGPVDLVLLTHDHHADNLDDAGRRLLADVPCLVTTESAARRLGGGAVGLAPWVDTTVERPDLPPIEVTATPCRHGPPLSHPIVGDVVGFALRLPGDGSVLWVSGDTVLYDGVRAVADRLDVDIALLHVGGVRFGITGPIRYTMTAAQGVELCGLVRPRIVVPVHYEGWSHFRDGPDDLDAALAAAPPDVAARFRRVELGVSTTLPGGDPG